MKKKENYEKPLMEVEEAVVEQGFASSKNTDSGNGSDWGNSTNTGGWD